MHVLFWYFFLALQSSGTKLRLFTCNCNGICTLEPPYRLGNGQLLIIARDFSGHATAISKRAHFASSVGYGPSQGAATCRPCTQVKSHGVVQKYNIVRGSETSSNHERRLVTFRASPSSFSVKSSPRHVSPVLCHRNISATGHVASPRGVQAGLSTCPLEGVFVGNIRVPDPVMPPL